MLSPRGCGGRGRHDRGVPTAERHPQPSRDTDVGDVVGGKVALANPYMCSVSIHRVPPPWLSLGLSDSPPQPSGPLQEPDPRGEWW